MRRSGGNRYISGMNFRGSSVTAAAAGRTAGHQLRAPRKGPTMANTQLGGFEQADRVPNRTSTTEVSALFDPDLRCILAVLERSGTPVGGPPG